MKSTVELLEELIAATEKCRSEQRRYFAYRDNLQRAKLAEERLDHVLMDTRHALKLIPKPVQQSLFS